MSNLYVNNVYPKTGSYLQVGTFVSAMGMGNARTISATVDVPADYNSVLFGPITIDTSGVLTIGSGSVIVVKDIGEV